MAKRRLIDRARGVLGIEHPEPEVEIQDAGPVETHGPPPPAAAAETGGETPAHFWPAGEPLPAVYVKRRRLPCPACRRTELATGSQAVACCSSGPDFAHFRCRSCGHRWKLAVRGEGGA